MRRLLTAGAAGALVLALAVAALAQSTSTSPTSTSAPAITLQRARKATATPDFKGRITFLVIGSDSGAPGYGRGGAVERGRADSIHLVVLDATKRRGVMIGIARDSYVPIPGHGTGKITGAMAFGGPGLLVRTVENLTNIGIDYWAVTSFDGLRRMVDKVGGIKVHIDMNLNDSTAGAHLRRGTYELNGARAVAYSRARKSVPGGDFARSRHQGLVLLGGLATYQEQIRRDPSLALRWVGAVKDEIKTDLPFPELVRLALFARQVSPRRVNNVVAAGVSGNAGGASIVRLTPAAYALFARVRSGSFA